jgi:hypothetical protein
MQTDCSVEAFDFGTVEGRAVEAGFDAGLVTSDAGGLLLGATDRAIGMMGRLAACFHDERRPELIEHEVATLVGQRYRRGRVLFFCMEVEQPEWLQHIGILLPAVPNDALFQARVVNTWPLTFSSLSRH